MATTFERASALETLRNEELGFRFGEPLRASENSLAVVIPILRETTAKRQYITLPEVNDKVDIRDTGHIDRFKVKNPTDEHLFIRYGTIFKGSTQERMLLRSAIVFANSEAEIAVRCVHASRGIHPNAKTGYGGYAPLDLEQSIYTSHFGTEKASQHNVWAGVARSSTVMNSYLSSSGAQRTRHTLRPLREDFAVAAAAAGIHDPVDREVEQVLGSADDLSSNMESFSKNFDAVIRSVERQENQTGFALITSVGVETIETFDSELSWKAIHEDSVKRVGTKLVDQAAASVFQYKPEKAKEAIQSVLSKKFDEKVIWEHKPSNGEPHALITGLAAGGYTGEVVEIDHRVTHLCIIKAN